MAPAQYSEYYQPLVSANSTAGDGSQSELAVCLKDLYQLVNEVRLKRREPLVGEEKPSILSTVYATEVSLLNCWGLIELDRVMSLPP